jgi:transmembrane sensor
MDLMENERTLQEAAGWHARLHSADCTEEDRLAFEQWRRSDVAHARAYEIAERTSSQLDSLVLDPRLQALALLAREEVAAESTTRRSRSRPGRAGLGGRRMRWTVPAALAASVAVAILAVRFLPDALDDGSATMAYESSKDKARSVTLSDGSTVQLDVGTRLTVQMSSERRRVTLLAGRAMFDVAHDRSRPFSVAAADSRTTALGTRFQVELDPAQVIVTLAQGSVAIDDESVAHEWHEQLQPGEQLSVDMQTAMLTKTTVDPSVVTSWTRGRHLFRSTPLHEAVDEVNRYAQKKIRIGDPSLADLPVGGNFIAGDSELIVAAFAAVLPLSVVNDGNKEIILFRRHEPQN